MFNSLSARSSKYPPQLSQNGNILPYLFEKVSTLYTGFRLDRGFQMEFLIITFKSILVQIMGGPLKISICAERFLSPQYLGEILQV